MKRLWGGVVAALVLAACLTPQNALAFKPASKSVPWDSLTAGSWQVQFAGGGVDTMRTKAIDTGDWDWLGATNQALFDGSGGLVNAAGAVLELTTANVGAAFDSFYVAIEWGFQRRDGSIVWQYNGIQNASVHTVAIPPSVPGGGRTFRLAILVDPTLPAGAGAEGSNIWLTRYIRFRVRPDCGSSASVYGVEARLLYPKLAGTP